MPRGVTQAVEEGLVGYLVEGTDVSTRYVLLG